MSIVTVAHEIIEDYRDPLVDEHSEATNAGFCGCDVRQVVPIRHLECPKVA